MLFSGALGVAVLVGLVFVGSCLLALPGRRLVERQRHYLIAVAAAILVALAFGDLFPAGLALAGRGGVAGFVGGFALLFLLETLSRAHTHHSPAEDVHRHAIMPFVLGLAAHNFTDGFALGMSAAVSGPSVAAIGVGVLIHQLPVGLSVAAVLAAAHRSHGTVVRIAVLLGLAIPLGAVLATLLPLGSPEARGIMLAAAAGVLAYVATGHLLPEAQAESPGVRTALVFAGTLLLMTVAIFTVFGD